MKESDIQSKIIKLLERNNAYVVKVVSATKAGVPDILACYKGKFIAIEVKVPEKKDNTSELQKYNLRKINESGGLAIVAWNEDMINEFLKSVIL